MAATELPRARRGRAPALAAWLAAALAAGAGGQEDGPGLEGPPRPSRVRGLVFEAPPGWRPVEPREGEHAAWSLVPPEEEELSPVERRGLSARASVVRLGAAERSLEEHVARWAGAFRDEAGDPVPAPPTTTFEAKGITVSVVRLRGTHVAPAYPGAEGPPVERSGWSAVYAHLRGPDGTWTAALTGPEAAVDRWREGFLKLLRSARVRPIDDPEAAAAAEAREREEDEEP